MRRVALNVQSVNRFFALHRSVVAVVVMFNVEHKLKIVAFCFQKFKNQHNYLKIIQAQCVFIVSRETFRFSESSI